MKVEWERLFYLNVEFCWLGDRKSTSLCMNLLFSCEHESAVLSLPPCLLCLTYDALWDCCYGVNVNKCRLSNS